MSATKAHGAIMDATAAAEVEGFFAPTVEQVAMLARLRDLNSRAAAIDTEAKAIKSAIVKQMSEKDARALVVNGRRVVDIVPKTKEEFYADQLAAQYPEIAAAFAEASVAYEAVVPEFTYRVEATAAHTFPGAR